MALGSRSSLSSVGGCGGDMERVDWDRDSVDELEEAIAAVFGVPLSSG